MMSRCSEASFVEKARQRTALSVTFGIQPLVRAIKASSKQQVSNFVLLIKYYQLHCDLMLAFA
jgi:hypothetical protein